VRKGFSHGVALDLIRLHPGKTAKEYAILALEQGLADSDSKTPVQSLANTLEKEAREGRMFEVHRVRDGGVYRYYPADQMPSTGVFPKEGDTAKGSIETITIRLPREVIEIADLATEVGAQSTRNEATLWLCCEGIKSNNKRIDEMRQAAKQIHEIKQRFSA
jgi:hypothetical protein